MRNCAGLAIRAHLDTTTKPAGDSLSSRRRSGERVRERGFQKSATIRWNEPLSPLVPRKEREQETSAMVGGSRCALAILLWCLRYKSAIGNLAAVVRVRQSNRQAYE